MINLCSIIFIDEILTFINIPQEVLEETQRLTCRSFFMESALPILYNYFSAAMRSIGNSVVPLVFLILSAVINIVLDIIFVVPLQMGIAGAAYAQSLHKAFQLLGIAVFCILRCPQIRLKRKTFVFK